MTYVIDLQRLWQDRKQVTSSTLQAPSSAPVSHRHMTISVIMVVMLKQKNYPMN